MHFSLLKGMETVLQLQLQVQDLRQFRANLWLCKGVQCRAGRGTQPGESDSAAQGSGVRSRAGRRGVSISAVAALSRKEP